MICRRGAAPNALETGEGTQKLYIVFRPQALQVLPAPWPQLWGNRGVGEGFAAPHGSGKKEELLMNQQRGVAILLVDKVEVAWVSLASLRVLSGCMCAFNCCLHFNCLPGNQARVVGRE